MRRLGIFLGTPLFVACLAACSGGSTTPPADGAAPDFLLLDVNATSPTFDTRVSPRDERGRVSAWYFGSAT